MTRPVLAAALASLALFAGCSSRPAEPQAAQTVEQAQARQGVLDRLIDQRVPLEGSAKVLAFSFPLTLTLERSGEGLGGTMAWAGRLKTTNRIEGEVLDEDGRLGVRLVEVEHLEGDTAKLNAVHMLWLDESVTPPRLVGTWSNEGRSGDIAVAAPDSFAGGSAEPAGG